MTSTTKSAPPKKPTVPKSFAGKKASSSSGSSSVTKKSGSKSPAAAAAKPKSDIAKKKSKPSKTVEKAAEAAADADADAETSTDPRTRVLNETKRRKKAKLVGYRRLAKDCGYNNASSGDVNSAAGLDANYCLLTLSDAKRLTRFIPASPEKVSFSEEEFRQRHFLSTAKVSTAAARESQVRCDYALKQILNRAALRCSENNAKQITAATIQSVLRPYVGKMQFTAVVPPLGLVRAAQVDGVLDYPEVDQSKADSEKETCKVIKELYQKGLESQHKKKPPLGKKAIKKAKA